MGEGPRLYFRTREVGVGGGVAYDDVVFGPVKVGRHYLITRHAAIDETSAPSTSIRGLVQGHGYDHLIWQKSTPAANTLYHDPDPIELFEGESLVARFTGATSADKLVLYLEGSWTESE